MIFALGTDIIETERIGEMVARGRQHLETVFTVKEIDYCEGKARKSQHYAVRYAAKEATFKALGIGWTDGPAYCDIEVLDDERGKPQVFVHGEVKRLFEKHGVRQSCVSLSHSRDNAIAVIILET